MALPNRFSRSKVEEVVSGYLFILPAIIVYLVFMIIPILSTFVLSFTNYQLLSVPKFMAFRNYIRALSDPRILRIYLNTLEFAFFAVVGNVGLGLLLAVLLNRKIASWLNYAFRFAYFVPIVVSYVYVSLVWSVFYAQDTGIINYYLNRLGLHSVGWLTDYRLALFSIIFMDIWKNVGFFMVIFLAALQGVPVEYYEAARLDGCTAGKLFRYITFPSISPTAFFCLIWASIGALQVFDAVYILTQGGPGDATRSIVVYVYQTAFQKFQLGSASSMSVILFIFINILTLVQFKISKRWVHS